MPPRDRSSIQDALYAMREEFISLRTELKGVPERLRVLEDKMLTYESRAAGGWWTATKLLGLGAGSGGLGALIAKLFP